jgi:hypothetical protein
MDLKDTAEKLIHGDVKGVISDVSKQLERTIGLVGIIIISLSAMLGSGLFVLPSFAAAMMGEGIWLAFLLAASVVLPRFLNQNWPQECLLVEDHMFIWNEPMDRLLVRLVV